MQRDATGSFLSLSDDAARDRVEALGGRPFHAGVIRRELLQRSVLDYAGMTGLSSALRTRLAAELPLLASREVARSQAKDGTIKLLLELADGATIEMVFMPSRKAGRGATLCISTQVGCPVGCTFCASGQGGLVRNLEAHEILEQYVHGRALGPVSRSVVMGIGEPLLNHANLLAALEVVRGELGVGARKTTVSTVGFPDLLRRLATRRPPFQLAISIHTPFDEQRAELIPMMAKIPLDEVLLAADHWFETTGREVTFEVCLMGGLNDSTRHAAALAERLARRRGSVNLIPYNPVPGEAFRRPTPDDVESYRATLEAAGIVATVRWSRGLEGDAACGQLRRRTG